eukprot:TRINITY_DN1454_c0_g1_i2.p1 TRINITY_DN1454_c0_g1~~TRINITY_DN1454_c0_g1_i2.p1  ORF type:complete len:374 (+),score=90.39 TRINITY_DN1454_c0_g1_i2:401-1522(+)
MISVDGVIEMNLESVGKTYSKSMETKDKEVGMLRGKLDVFVDQIKRANDEISTLKEKIKEMDERKIEQQVVYYEQPQANSRSMETLIMELENKEREFLSMKLKYLEKEKEAVLLSRTNLINLDQILELQREIKEKDKEYLQLLAELNTTKRLSTPQSTPVKASKPSSNTTNTPSKSGFFNFKSTIIEKENNQPTPSSDPTWGTAEDRIQNLMAANQAHQTHNSFLSNQIQRLFVEKKESLAEKDQIIQSLMDDMRNLNQKYQDMRRTTLLEGKSVSQEFLNDVEELKRDYFYSLAFGIKVMLFGTGAIVNIPLDEIYDKIKTLEWHTWKTWTNQEFFNFLNKQEEEQKTPKKVRPVTSMINNNTSPSKEDHRT